MTTGEPLERYRSEFPITQDLVYMNHAGSGPLSVRATTAISQFIDGVSRRGSEASEEWVSRSEEVRAKAARFIGADADEIAFMKNTPDGVNAVANGLPWREGDNVVTVDNEFPANIYPWMNLRDRGVETRLVPTENGCVAASQILSAIDEKTRVVALSWVEFHGGFRHDLATIGAACRERGIYLAVDAVQGLGALPCDVRELNVDFLSAAAHKWMLGPNGIAVFYVRRELLDDVRVAAVGVTGVDQGPSYLDYGFRLRPNARRFECGFLNLLGIAGLEAAIDLFNDVGRERVAARVLLLTGRLTSGLHRQGYLVYGPRADETRSGVVSFRHPSLPTADLVHRLRLDRVVVADREHHVRVSPHFYNTESEVDHLLDALPPV